MTKPAKKHKKFDWRENCGHDTYAKAYCGPAIKRHTTEVKKWNTLKPVTFLAGEEPAQVCTKHVSNGTRFSPRDALLKGKFYSD